MRNYEYIEDELGFVPVAELDADSRATFMRRTYAHLMGAIALFTFMEVAIFKLGWARPIASTLLGTSWLLVLGGFIILGYLANGLAQQAESKALQYVALLLYTTIEAIIFVPLLFIANAVAPGVIQSAAGITLAGFAALSVVAMTSKTDFTFLGNVLRWGFIGALLLIVGGVIFGFQLGLYFSVGMVVLAGASVLYETSAMIHYYPEDRYVAAALGLFASIALMFWYVIQIFLLSRD